VFDQGGDCRSFLIVRRVLSLAHWQPRNTGFGGYRRWFVSNVANPWFPFSEAGFNAVGMDAAVAWRRSAL